MSDVDNKVKMIVEGLLLSAGRPLSLDNIIGVFSEDEKPDRQELKAVMDAISEECDDRGFELKEVASGFRFQVKQELSEWVAKLWEERPPRYTRALLETLALIAYRQPITRGDIEEIRGVAVSANIIRTLLDREWIRVVGHRDVPGRPAMFATTKQFLDYFNLKSLQELPPLAEIKELDSTSEDLDFEDGLANQRVIDLPEESVDENSVEPGDAEKAEMLAEEEAIELAKKPLDEILNLDPARNTDSPDDDADGEEGFEDEGSEQEHVEQGGAEQGAAGGSEEPSAGGSEEPSVGGAEEPGETSAEYPDNQDEQPDDAAEQPAAETVDSEAETAADNAAADIVAGDEILAEDDSVADDELDAGERFDVPEVDNPDPSADELNEFNSQETVDADPETDQDADADESASDPITRSGSE